MTAVLLDGVVVGLQLAVLGVGLTLVFGLGGVLNLAYGQLAVVAAIVGAVLLRAGVATAAAVVLAVVAAGLLAWLLDASLLRPAYAHTGQARVQRGLLLTLAAAFVIDGLLITFHPFTAFSLAVGGPSVEVLGVTMRSGSLVASGIALVVLLALLLHLRCTRSGRAIRAVAQDEDGARLCGIDPGRVRTVVVVASGVLAGVVAVTQALVASVDATSGLELTVLALVVAVVGGLGSVAGALVAGLLLGLVHAVASFHLGAMVTAVLLLSTAVLTVLVRPSGLFARRVT